MTSTYDNIEFEREFASVARAHHQRIDAARRTPSFFLSTMVSVLFLACAPLLPNAEPIFGKLQIGTSLWATVPGFVFWVTNFWLYRTRGPSHWLYRCSQDLELIGLNSFIFILIWASGSVVSVLWAAVVTTAVYWATLRPTQVRRNLIIPTVLFVPMILAFLLSGKTSEAWIGCGVFLAIVAIHIVASQAICRSLYAEAKKNLVERALMNLRFEGERRQLEDGIESRVGQQLSTLIDELESVNDQGDSPSPSFVDQAKEALSAISVAVRKLNPNARRTLKMVVVEIERKCRRLVSSFDLSTSGNIEQELSLAQARALIRSAQELTRNAVMHGGAESISVRISVNESLRLSFRDDGSGLSQTAWERGGGGIRNLHAWLRDCDGEVRFEPQPKGSLIHLVVPLTN